MGTKEYVSLDKEQNKMTKIVNLFGGPGSGKSTGAARIFSELKLRGINAELIQEHAKDLAWENTLLVYYNPFDIGVQQYKRQHRLLRDCSVAITDSPLLMQSVYVKDDSLFEGLMDGLFQRFDNLNFFVRRLKEYNPKGRTQTYEEAVKKDYEILELLENKKIPFEYVDGTPEGYSKVILKVLSEI